MGAGFCGLFVSEMNGLVDLHAFRIFGPFWLLVRQPKPSLHGVYVLISFINQRCY